MSDDLVKALETMDWDDIRDRPSAAGVLMEEAAAEIARLRAELATARLVPPLNFDRWRGAINDALTNWMDSILDDEVPKDALCRLIRYEVTAALDPAVSQSAADLVATARRKGMEDAAKIADREPELVGAMPAEFEKFSRETLARAASIATKRGIAAAIRAAAKDRQP